MLTYDPFRIAAAHLEFWNNNNITPLKELLAPQGTFRFIFEKDERPALKALPEILKLYRDAFPDLRFTHTNIIPTATTLVIEWVATGTHKGLFQGIPATGKIGHVRGANIFKLNEDGKIVKETAHYDLAALLTALGVMPKPVDETRIRELVNNFIDAVNRHDVIQMMTSFTPDHVAVLADGKVLRAQEHMQYMTGVLLAFPDMKVELKELAIRGNEAVTTYRVTGKNDGPMLNIPATHRKIEIENCSVITLAGDKLTRVHYYEDTFSMLRELNVIPEPVPVR